MRRASRRSSGQRVVGARRGCIGNGVRLARTARRQYVHAQLPLPPSRSSPFAVRHVAASWAKQPPRPHCCSRREAPMRSSAGTLPLSMLRGSGWRAACAMSRTIPFVIRRRVTRRALWRHSATRVRPRSSARPTGAFAQWQERGCPSPHDCFCSHAGACRAIALRRHPDRQALALPIASKPCLSCRTSQLGVARAKCERLGQTGNGETEQLLAAAARM
jgi:hypothetical protein